MDATVPSKMEHSRDGCGGAAICRGRDKPQHDTKARLSPPIKLNLKKREKNDDGQ